MSLKSSMREFPAPFHAKMRMFGRGSAGQAATVAFTLLARTINAGHAARFRKLLQEIRIGRL